MRCISLVANESFSSATCVYLSCKVEEFNVSIEQFVSNVKGDRTKAMDIILSNELLLMQELNYNLTVHNPFRPVEGFLIDIKTRSQMSNPDRLRKGIDDFLGRQTRKDLDQQLKLSVRRQILPHRRLSDIRSVANRFGRSSARGEQGARKSRLVRH